MVSVVGNRNKRAKLMYHVEYAVHVKRGIQEQRGLYDQTEHVAARVKFYRCPW